MSFIEDDKEWLEEHLREYEDSKKSLEINDCDYEGDREYDLMVVEEYENTLNRINNKDSNYK